MKLAMTALALAAALVAGAAHADARDDVVAAFHKVMEDGSYRMTMTADTDQGPMETRMDVQWPDRFHMKHAGGEFIILPAGTWMNAGGQWMKVPMNMSQMIDAYSKDAMEKGVDAIRDVTLVGEETVQGCDARHYRYNASGEFMGVKSDSESEVWICEDSGLPVQMVSGERGKDARVRIVYDWDATIDIRAPG